MSLNKKAAVIALIASLAVAIIASVVLNKPRRYVIGIVSNNPGLELAIAGFKKGMEKYGYIEGKNVHYIYGGIQKNMEQVDAALKDLIAKKVDLIVTVATPVTKRAKQLTKSNAIPVVFSPVFFAAESGLVENLTRPGGNLTGIQIGGNTQKALEWHKAVLPRSKLIYVPFNPGEAACVQSFEELMKGAVKLGVKLAPVIASDIDELENALNNIPPGVDSIWLLNSHFFVDNISLFTNAALRRKLVLSSGTSQLRHGVFLTYSQRPFHTGEQASRLAHQILKGLSPADLPVETADYFLGISLRTAAEIGVVVPDSVLQQADLVVR